METRVWNIAADPPESLLGNSDGLERVFTRLLYLRGIQGAKATEKFLNLSMSDMSDSMATPGMEAATEHIMHHIKAGKPIGVFGDFDVDGLTATAILTRSIREIGGNAMPYIPNRDQDGHGLSEKGIKAFKDTGINLIVTVDTGTNARDEIKLAKDSGIDVVVTDHHLPEGELPPALAIVNPCMAFPDRQDTPAGAGVAFKMAQALFDRAGKDIPNSHIQLCALGTVADSMPLKGENRIMVHAGLNYLKGTTHPGLKSLIKVSGAGKLSRITAETVSFYIAPRLNAPGRLGDAEPSLQLLLTEEKGEAEILSEKLEQMNATRRNISAEVEASARSQLESQTDAKIKFILCENTTPGILGPTAGRIAGETGCPTVAYTNQDGLIRASARSIPQFNIHRALEPLAELLLRFGGHAQAAGLTATPENFPKVRDSLEAAATLSQISSPWENILTADAEISLSELSDSLWRLITRMEPFGVGNPAPVFIARSLIPENVNTVGKDSAHLRMDLTQNGCRFNSIGFRMGSADLGSGKIDAAFSLKTDTWGNRARKQLHLHDIHPSQTQPI